MQIPPVIEKQQPPILNHVVTVGGTNPNQTGEGFYDQKFKNMMGEF